MKPRPPAPQEKRQYIAIHTKQGRSRFHHPLRHHRHGRPRFHHPLRHHRHGRPRFHHPPPPPQARAVPVASPPPSPQARAVPVSPPPPPPQGRAAPLSPARSSDPAGQRAHVFPCDQTQKRQLNWPARWPYHSRSPHCRFDAHLHRPDHALTARGHLLTPATRELPPRRVVLVPSGSELSTGPDLALV